MSDCADEFEPNLKEATESPKSSNETDERADWRGMSDYIVSSAVVDPLLQEFILRESRKRGIPEDQHDDVVQTICLKLLMPTFRYQGLGQLYSWVCYQIWAYRTEHYRTINAILENQEEYWYWLSGKRPQDPTEAIDLSDELRVLCAELDENQRKAFLMKYDEDMTFEDISRVLGLTGNQAYRLYQKSRAIIEAAYLRRNPVESTQSSASEA